MLDPFRPHLAAGLRLADRPECTQVCDWWSAGGKGVLALVGISGTGKTAIAAHSFNHFRMTRGRIVHVTGDGVQGAMQGQGQMWRHPIHSLLLPTGELVGIARPEQLWVETHGPQEVTRQDSGCRRFGAVDARSIGDRILDWHTGIERRDRRHPWST